MRRGPRNAAVTLLLAAAVFLAVVAATAPDDDRAPLAGEGEEGQRADDGGADVGDPQVLHEAAA